MRFYCIFRYEKDFSDIFVFKRLADILKHFSLSGSETLQLFDYFLILHAPSTCQPGFDLSIFMNPARVYAEILPGFISLHSEIQYSVAARKNSFTKIIEQIKANKTNRRKKWI